MNFIGKILASMKLNFYQGLNFKSYLYFQRPTQSKQRCNSIPATITNTQVYLLDKFSLFIPASL